MRCSLLVATVLSWVFCFTRNNAGAMAVWLFFGIVGLIATTMAFAQARIRANARPESMIDLMRHPPRHDDPRSE